MDNYSASVNEVTPEKRPVVDHQGHPLCAPSNVIPFRFEEKQVRTIEQDGDVWFVAADVCSVLAIKNHRESVRHLDDDEKGTQIVRTLGGDQQVHVVNESGLYALVLRSRKPEARRFVKWVTAEVLPAIRKHGRYVDSDSRMATLIGETIGTDGFHMLGSLIKGKVASLPSASRRRATMKIWSQTHAAFGVRSAADIPAEQLDAARNFIAAYALEGEWIKASNLTSMELKDDEIQSLHIILTQLGHLMGRIGSIERAGSALGSELLSAVFSHLYEARPHLQELMRKRGDEVRRLYQARFNTGFVTAGSAAA